MEENKKDMKLTTKDWLLLGLFVATFVLGYFLG